MSKTRISVAMTTYNGSKYIQEQLESIKDQTLMTDEVIICDDGSTDNTVSIVREFIKKNRLKDWLVEVNDPNVGWKKNFFKAISKTTGDIVFFSDQDDVWKRDKIETMAKLMSEKGMACLYANKDFIDEKGKPLQGRQEKASFTNSLKKIELSPSFYDIKTLGCCMCVNRKVADLYIKLSYPEGGHDSQCGRIAVLCENLYYLDCAVINYRIHKHNTSGISGEASFGQSSKSQRINDVEIERNWLLKVIEEVDLSHDKKEMINGIISFLDKRISYLRGQISAAVLPLNRQYYTSWTMLMGDIAYRHEWNKKLGKIRWNINKLLKL